MYIHIAHLSLYMCTCMMLYIYTHCITLCTVKPLFKNPLHRWIAGCTPIMLLEIRTLGYPGFAAGSYLPFPGVLLGLCCLKNKSRTAHDH